MSDPVGLEPRFSDDRQWYWNGSAWIPASQAPAPPPPPGSAPSAPTSPSYAAMPQGGAAVMAIPPRRGHLGRNLAIGCGGLIALFIVIAIAAAAASSGSKQSPVSAVVSPSAASTKQPVATSSPKATTAPAAPKVLLDKTGSGISKTAIFSTPSEWQIVYTFDCSNFGQKGKFQIYVYDGSSQLVDLPANDLASKGSDTVFEHNLSGPYYLQMNSECRWHVVVKA